MDALVESGNVVIFSQPVGPFAMNEMLVGCKRRGRAALIDSGDDPAPFIQAARNANLTIDLLLQTHAHIDHVAGLGATKQALPLPLYLHTLALPVYQSVPQQGQMFGFHVDPLPPIDHYYDEGDIVEVGALRFEILHTPGHSPGHVCLYERSEGILLGGDLLFRRSIGRTDLPMADPRAMEASLRRIMELPDDVRVFPGHMGPTTIGEERQLNPFLRSL